MAKHDAILDAAEVAFAADGYAASLDRVAERAGVSKHTIYKHFGAKDGLFDAMALRRVERMTEPLMLAPPAMAAPDVLRALAMRFLDLMAAGDFHVLMRVVLSAGPETDLAGRFYRAGPARSLARTAAFIQRQHEDGGLVAPDAMLAAEHFHALVFGHVQLQGLLGVLVPMDMAAKLYRADRAVAAFMAAYGPAPR